VITSNTSALPEVVGDAAILIDPHSSEELCHAMWMVLSDADLRLRMRQQGLERAQKFSWQRTAQQTLAVYEELCPERSQGERVLRIGRKIQKSWDQLGKEDPFWAVLTHPDKKGGRWATEEFFAMGRQDIRAILEKIASLGVTWRWDKALDFGCGPGRLAQSLAEYFQEVHGVDIAPSMIAKAKELNRHGQRCVYHLNEAPHLRLFEDDTFDFIYSALVLQHVPRSLALAYIVEFIRILKPGGLAVFQVPDHRRLAIVHGDEGGDGLPRAFWEENEPVMIMSGVPSASVVQAIAEAGGHAVATLPDENAGPDWVSYLYVAIKLPEAACKDRSHSSS
jgi:SAM-dependent methyltransferase